MADPAYEVRTIDRLIAVANHGDDGAEATRLYRQVMDALAQNIIECGGKHKASLTSRSPPTPRPSKATPRKPASALWEGETTQLVPVRLQYRRLPGGRVAWVCTLIEWRRVIRFAVKTEAERVHSATQLPLFYGAPSI